MHCCTHLKSSAAASTPSPRTEPAAPQLQHTATHKDEARVYYKGVMVVWCTAKLKQPDRRALLLSAGRLTLQRPQPLPLSPHLLHPSLSRDPRNQWLTAQGKE
jgi:hypothetical protein